VIVWLNGTHGAGKTTTSRLLQPLLPGSRILDAEKVGEVLMDVRPGLPESDNFQHWDPWRPLVVETARRVHDYVGGPLIMPMTVLVEAYWREIAAGLADHGIPIQNDPIVGPSTFRFAYVDAYAEAARGWLHAEAEVIDATEVPATEVARAVADAVTSAR